jgi:chaperone required for assembly of F1-ATPase
MKRFYADVSACPVGNGWQVQLDARGVRTAGGLPQIVPTPALADLLAAEWRTQGDEIDPRTFIMRDMADYAIDLVARERPQTVAKLLTYGESDTLCYRADPDEPLYQRQRALWEPLVTAAEARLGVSFKRVSGILHRAQPPETLAALHKVLAARDDFVLAGLVNLASLSASLIVALAALEPDADAAALFSAANAEEDWQAELWGWDWLAEDNRALRAEAFRLALAFCGASRGASCGAL